jgi:hypothetical protein
MYGLQGLRKKEFRWQKEGKPHKKHHITKKYRC